MAESMEIDMHKKRPLSDTDTDTSPHPSESGTAHTRTSPKRARRHAPAKAPAISLIPLQHAVAFNAIAHLKTLAYTQLYVTANYSKLDPTRSPVLLYLKSSIDPGYATLW